MKNKKILLFLFGLSLVMMVSSPRPVHAGFFDFLNPFDDDSFLNPFNIADSVGGAVFDVIDFVVCTEQDIQAAIGIRRNGCNDPGSGSATSAPIELCSGGVAETWTAVGSNGIVSVFGACIDKKVYAPGETVTFKASGYSEGNQGLAVDVYYYGGTTDCGRDGPPWKTACSISISFPAPTIPGLFTAATINGCGGACAYGFLEATVLGGPPPATKMCPNGALILASLPCPSIPPQVIPSQVIPPRPVSPAACEICPSGWTAIAGKCMLSNELEGFTQSGAIQKCTELGGWLPSVADLDAISCNALDFRPNDIFWGITRTTDYYDTRVYNGATTETHLGYHSTGATSPGQCDSYNWCGTVGWSSGSNCTIPVSSIMPDNETVYQFSCLRNQSPLLLPTDPSCVAPPQPQLCGTRSNDVPTSVQPYDSQTPSNELCTLGAIQNSVVSLWCDNEHNGTNGPCPSPPFSSNYEVIGWRWTCKSGSQISGCGAPYVVPTSVCTPTVICSNRASSFCAGVAYPSVPNGCGQTCVAGIGTQNCPVGNSSGDFNWKEVAP